MTCLTIIWSLLCLATVKVHSEVDLTEGNNLEAENSWNGITESKHDETAHINSVDNQDNVENDSRNGLEGFSSLPTTSTQLSGSDASINVDRALNENSRHDVSVSSNRISNDSQENNDDNLADLIISFDPMTDYDDQPFRRSNSRNVDILNIIDGSVDLEGLSGPFKDDNRFNVFSRSGHDELNPLNTLDGSILARMNILNRLGESDANELNGSKVNEIDGTRSSDKNLVANVDVLRLADLNGVTLSSLNKPNDADITARIGSAALSTTNGLSVTSRSNGDKRLSRCKDKSLKKGILIDANEQRISRNDLDNLHKSDDLLDVIDAIQSRRGAINGLIYNDRNLRNMEGVMKGGNLLRNNALKNLKTNAVLKIALNREVENISPDLVRNGKSVLNKVNHLDSPESLDVDSNTLNLLNDLGKSESRPLRNCENKEDLKCYNDLMETNRNGIQRVSLNRLNQAKRLLKPVNLNKVILAGRSSNEVNEAILNALKSDDDFNALGALAILSKAGDQTNLLNALDPERLNSFAINKVNSRIEVEKNNELNSLRNLDGSDNAIGIDELADILNNVYKLGKNDAASDVELNSQGNLENLSSNKVHSMVDLNEAIHGSRSSWGNNRLRNLVLGSGRINKNEAPTYVNRLRRPHSVNGPHRQYGSHVAKYPYRSKANGDSNIEENLNNSVKIAKLLNVKHLSENNPVGSVKGSGKEYNIEDLLSSADKGGLADIPVGLNAAQLKLPIETAQLNAAEDVSRNENLNEISNADETELSMSTGIGRGSISRAINDVKHASNLLLAASIGNSNKQRRKSPPNLNILANGGVDAYSNLLPLPIRINSKIALNRGGLSFGILGLGDLDDLN